MTRLYTFEAYAMGAEMYMGRIGFKNSWENGGMNLDGKVLKV